MGYGVLRLTDTLNKPSDTEDSYYTTMIEKGLIRSNFVYSIEEDLENEYFDDEESVFDEEEEMCIRDSVQANKSAGLRTPNHLPRRKEVTTSCASSF